MPFLQPELTKYGTGQDIYALAGSQGTGGTGSTGPTGAIGPTGMAGMGQTGPAGVDELVPQAPSIDLGGTPGVATSLGDGGFVAVSSLSAIPVIAGQRYRVNVYSVLTGTQSYTGTQYAQTAITFSNTADVIILNSEISIGSALGVATELEFRVPATNTSLSVGVQGLGITGGNTVSVAIFSFNIVPLGI